MLFNLLPIFEAVCSFWFVDNLHTVQGNFLKHILSTSQSEYIYIFTLISFSAKVLDFFIHN